MQGTLFAIISNSRVYRKLLLEIDTAISQKLVSSPIRDSEARQLPYLQACILEGLRLNAPVSQLRERMVPPEGDVINGHRVPGGTYVGFNTRGTQLDEVYGDDPEAFRPERWLVQDRERLQAMHRTHELIFGHGGSKCLGIRIAAMQLNKIFFEVSSSFLLVVISCADYLGSQILRTYDITIASPISPWESICYGSFFQKNFKVRITRRE